jgi:hypothetical protein
MIAPIAKLNLAEAVQATKPLKTIFLSAPSFEKFGGAASSCRLPRNPGKCPTGIHS